MKRLLITTGDPDGVGSEITAKALQALGPQPGIQFVLFRSMNCPRSDLRRIDSRFTRVAADLQALPPIASARSSVILDVTSLRPAARWVENAAKLCLAGRAAGLITAPLSKTGIAAAGMKDRGHTEIFSRLCGGRELFMGFRGRHFNVLLLTDHIPLMRASRKLSPRRLRAGLDAARQLRLLTGSRKPIAVLGLNPHAGEEGLLGQEERLLRPLLRAKEISGPLVPDTAFLPGNWRKYSVFVCPYHDQGLIPFKLVHGFDEGVHLTLGLPFVRTSVDHGTAKELFGRNRAKYGSMKEAIQLAVRMSKGKK